MPDLTRLTVNLVPRAVEALDSIAARQDETRTDSINRALIGWDIVLDLIEKGGGQLSLTHADGTRETVRVL
jgi:hypothetical protein